MHRRLIGYARVSTDEQAAHGVSLDAQKARLTAYIAAFGDECVGIEVDSASGALKPERRPGLVSALARVRAGDADGIAVTKLDRLSRSTIDTLQLLERAEREGWGVLSVAEHLDTRSATGRFTVAVFAAAAEMERDLISERTRAAMKQIENDGRGRSRRLPFGFRLEGEPTLTEMPKGNRSKLVPDPGEQQILRQILRLHAGGKGAHAIVSAFNRRGLKNPRTRHAWSVGGMRAVLATAMRNPALRETVPVELRGSNRGLEICWTASGANVQQSLGHFGRRRNVTLTADWNPIRAVRAGLAAAQQRAHNEHVGNYLDRRVIGLAEGQTACFHLRPRSRSGSPTTVASYRRSGAFR